MKKLEFCRRCGNSAEIRHVRIRDLGMLIKFHFHSNQYYVYCTGCSAKTRAYHKEELAIKDWNDRRNLKFCPFCGGTAELKLSRVKGFFRRLFSRFTHYQYVKCSKCGASTELQVTTENATDKWNMRI